MTSSEDGLPVSGFLYLSPFKYLNISISFSMSIMEHPFSIDERSNKEVYCLSQILEACMEKGEIAACGAGKVAKSTLAVTEAIKNKTSHSMDCNLTSGVSYTGRVSEVVYTVSFILDGLKIH